MAGLAGLAVALLVLLAGWAFLQQRPIEYRASTTLVVLPDQANAEAASYYETLSQGQIATTFAQILDLQSAPPAPADGSDPAKISVDVLPDTSLIQVTATADAASTAETAADATLTQVRPYFDQLGWPYDVSVVAPAVGTAERSGFSPAVLLGAVAAVALVAAIATYLAVRALQRSRVTRPAAAPVGPRRVLDRPTVPSGAPTADRAETHDPTDAESARPASNGNGRSAASPRTVAIGGSAAQPTNGAHPTTAAIGASPLAASPHGSSDGSHPVTTSEESHPAADPQPAR